MPTRRIAPSVLGHEVERLFARETAELDQLLRRADEATWQRPTPAGGSTVAEVVGHLAEDAERISRAWREQAVELGHPLFHAFEEEKATHEQPIGSPEELVARYTDGMRGLLHLLSQVRQEQWAWPSMNPIGGVETLAEAARRWLAHHYIHRQDLRQALGRPFDRHEETVRHVVESVLDALARRGGDVVPRPMAFQLVTSAPGAGTWTLYFDDPESLRGRDLELWQELLNWRPPDPPDHRVERGSTEAPRVTVRGDGELVWRAAFSRGGSWGDLDVHGDDRAVEVWKELIGTLNRRGLQTPIGGS